MLVGAAVGLIFSTTILYDRSRGPFTLEEFLAIASWYVLASVAVFSSISAIFALYNPYPRALKGLVTLDRVEQGRLWFYSKDDRRGSISLPKQKVNVHDELTIHFGLLPRNLELRTQTADEMRLLVNELRDRVRSLRTYESKPGERAEGSWQERKNWL